MNEPDEWTIKDILHRYCNDLNKIKNQPCYYNFEDKLDKKYLQMIYLIFSNHQLSFCDLMTVENFIQDCKDGSFCNYDGIGYYLDWDGNKLKRTNCATAEQYPEGTVFVAWYNK